MSFLKEKVLVPIITGLVVLLMGANPWKFDTVQRLSGAIALIAAAVFISRTVSFNNDKEPKAPPSESALPEPSTPQVKISSHDQKGGITAQTVIQGDQINAPQLNVNIHNFFSGDPKVENLDETIESREFRLLLKPAATITLGECPGEDCMKFELGTRNEKEGLIVQTIFLSGEGLGLVPTVGPYQGIKHNGKFRINGATMFATTDGKVGVDFPLKAATQFEIVTAKYVVTMRLTEVAIDNLKLRISYRFAKDRDNSAAGDNGANVIISEFEMSTGIPPPSFILDTAVVVLNSDKDTPLERKRDAAMHVLSHFITLLNDGSDKQISDFLLAQRWPAESTRKAVEHWRKAQNDFGRIVSFQDGRFDFRVEPPPHNARIVQIISWDSGRTTRNEYFFTIENNFIGLSSYGMKDAPNPTAEGSTK